MAVEQLIYTDRPHGKGADPTKAGYQVKARSSGLAPEVLRQLENVCLHYGDAVYRCAPQRALDEEMDWRANAQGPAAMPEAVLGRFPVAWSYEQVAENTFALTRVGYIGFTFNREKPGNFFAHSLVFKPEALAGHRFNSLALAQTGLFRTNDLSDDTSLPVLADLGSSTEAGAGCTMLQGEPYRRVLPALLSALMRASPAKRPVLVCLADWHDSMPLVRELLDCLPPSARCRTTFATYESDRRWLMPTPAGARPANLVAAHHLLVLCQRSRQPLDLRADEYQSFAIFNFVDDKFSDVGPASPYAVFAAGCVATGTFERLARCHELLRRLRCDADASQWDTLVGASPLLEPAAPPEAVARALSVAVPVARGAAQALATLELVLPQVAKLAEAGDWRALSSWRDSLIALVDRLPLPARPEPLPGPVLELRRLAGHTLAKGAARAATELFAACGRMRDRVFAPVLEEVVGKSPDGHVPAATADDGDALIGLLVEGLQQVSKVGDLSGRVDRWLVAIFRAARDRGEDGLRRVWRMLAASVIQPRLASAPLNQAKQLQEDLLECAADGRCPEACAWLTLAWMRTSKPQGDQLLAKLKEAARNCTGWEQADRFARELVDWARTNIDGPEAWAVALGQMAEAAHDRDTGDLFYAAYQGAVDLARDQRRTIQARLADAGARQVLCREALQELLPWDEQTGPKRLQSWRDGVFGRKPGLLEAFFLHTARRLEQSPRPQDVLPLAQALLPKQGNQGLKDAGLLALLRATVLALPLRPLSDKWARLLEPPPDQLAADAAARLRLLKFMTDVEEQATQPAWSGKQFPFSAEAWRKDARDLAPEAKAQVLHWAVGTFEAAGAEHPDEAQTLVELHLAVGERSPDKIAASFARLLRGRDPTTDIVVTTALVDCLLAAKPPSPEWTEIIGALTSQLDGDTRKRLVARLSHRFGRRERDYDERLARLCAALDLPQPEIQLPAQPPQLAPPPILPEAGPLDKFKDSLGRGIGKLFGGGKPPPPADSRGGKGR
jgi:hypothetical protein